MKIAGFLAAFVCFSALLAVGQHDEDAQSRIIALEQAWNQAYKLADRKALDQPLDDKIVIVNDDGSRQDKSEFLASVKKSNSQEQQVTPESITVHIYGNAATATGVFSVKGTEGGKCYLHRERFLDTWIDRDGKWQCAAASATTIR